METFVIIHLGEQRESSSYRIPKPADLPPSFSLASFPNENQHCTSGKMIALRITRRFSKRVYGLIQGCVHTDTYRQRRWGCFFYGPLKALFGGHQTALKNSHFLFLGRQPLQHHLLPPAGALPPGPPEKQPLLVPLQELNFSKPSKGPFMMRKMIW